MVNSATGRCRCAERHRLSVLTTPMNAAAYRKAAPLMCATRCANLCHTGSLWGCDKLQDNCFAIQPDHTYAPYCLTFCGKRAHIAPYCLCFAVNRTLTVCGKGGRRRALRSAPLPGRNNCAKNGLPTIAFGIIRRVGPTCNTLVAVTWPYKGKRWPWDPTGTRTAPAVGAPNYAGSWSR